MKVGIVTFHFAVNYGAVLQAYATCSMLRRIGHEPMVIDYRPRGSLYEHYHQWSFSRFGLNGQNLLKLRLNPMFSSFRKYELPIDSKIVNSPEELAQYSTHFDAILYGSDQIWNPSIFKGLLDYGYWAVGVPNTVRRIALSASFGGDLEAIRSYKSEIDGLVQNFDAISVREKDALDILKESVTGGLSQLGDPVFGVESWDHLFKPVKGLSEFMFEFAVQPRQLFKETSQLISEAMGLKSVCADARLNLAPKHTKSMAFSVGQWLWSIKNARLVVTNSFHATVFCIIFNTPFVFVPLEGQGELPNPRNNRIFDLLNWSGLESRIWCRDQWERDHLGFVEMHNDEFQLANSAVLERRLALKDYLKNKLS